MALTVGALIRLPDCPEWGLGQVQSVIGARVTANFEHVGKQTLNAEVIYIELVND